VARADAYLHAKFHLDPSNRLATVHQRHRQTAQRTNSIGQTVLQTVAQLLTTTTPLLTGSTAHLMAAGHILRIFNNTHMAKREPITGVWAEPPAEV